MIQDSDLSLSIFDNSQLLFAQHMSLQNSEDTSDELKIEDHDDSDEMNLEEDSIDLDNIDVDDSLDDLDVFGDIEDLDSIEEIEEFADVDDDISDETQFSKDPSQQSSNQKMKNFLTKTTKDFY